MTEARHKLIASGKQSGAGLPLSVVDTLKLVSGMAALDPCSPDLVLLSLVGIAFLKERCLPL